MKPAILSLTLAVLALGAASPAHAAGYRKVYYNQNGIVLTVETELESAQKNTYHLRVFVENRNKKGADIVGYVTYSFRNAKGVMVTTRLDLQRFVAAGATTAWKPGTFRDLIVRGATITKVTLR